MTNLETLLINVVQAKTPAQMRRTRKYFSIATGHDAAFVKYQASNCQKKAAGRTRLSICKAPSFKLPEEGCRQGAGQVKPSSTLLCHKVLSLMCASFEAAGTGFFVGAYCFVRKCIVLYQCMSNLHKLNRAGCPSVLAKKALRRCVVCHFQLPKCLQQKA